ncbi:translation initiation factor IF-2 subunit beta [Candidatus Woesearchaeota archaeon]|nr:translation initiation factor IF-2 subunit beta [Candidatus Woesearchaeota archaeon]
MDYEKLLDRAIENLPKEMDKGERFEIPNVMGHIQGNKTIISNFNQIADALNRKPEHVLKFVLKELGTPGDIRKNEVVFGSKVSANRINEKIKQYAYEFVFCAECKKPDTILKKEGGITFLKCQACGYKHVVKASF